MHELLDCATATPLMPWVRGVLAVERGKPRDKIQINIVLRLRTPVFRLSSPDSSLGPGQISILVLLASHRLDILCLDSRLLQPRSSISLCLTHLRGSRL